jgi:hypothetical protein
MKEIRSGSTTPYALYRVVKHIEYALLYILYINPQSTWSTRTPYSVPRPIDYRVPCYTLGITLCCVIYSYISLSRNA